jgi:hypothetical protein
VTAVRGSWIYTPGHLRSRHSGAGRDSYFPPDFPHRNSGQDRHINGFNDSADPKDLEHDLTQALVEFKESAAKDPAFVDAKIGTISCLGNLMYLSPGHADRVQELLSPSRS